MELWSLLGVRPGVTAVIGSGGKTTLLRALGKELAASHRVLLCTTTKIYPFPGIPLAETAEDLERLATGYPLICAGGPVAGTGKLTAPKQSLAELAERFDYVLVEADGSAGRPLKAHASHEPVIPSEANRTICVVGASGFGRPIREAVHRPERYAALAGVSESAAATPETEAAVLRAEGLGDIIYVNQAETDAARAAARNLAGLLKIPVMAGSLWRGEYETCW